MQEEALSLQKPVETSSLRGKRKVKTLSLFVFLPISLSLCRSLSAFLENCSRKRRTVLASFPSSRILHFHDFCKTSVRSNPLELSWRIGQSLSNVDSCWTMRHSAITGDSRRRKKKTCDDTHESDVGRESNDNNDNDVERERARDADLTCGLFFAQLPAKGWPQARQGQSSLCGPWQKRT